MKRLALLIATTTALALAPSADAALIHEWQGDANAHDSVGTNNGSLVGDTTFTTGVSGQAFSFDGTNGVGLTGSVNGPLNITSNQLSISAWITAGAKQFDASEEAEPQED